jgi:hypothetical protein
VQTGKLQENHRSCRDGEACSYDFDSCRFASHSLARLKREQGQAETDDLLEDAMQRSLIWEKPREQSGSSLLLLEA